MGPISWVVLVFISTTRGIIPFDHNIQPQSYIKLVYPTGMSSVYEFYTRSGFPAGTIGSELMAVVLPPVGPPGRSRLVPWYEEKRSDWYNVSGDLPEREMLWFRLNCLQSRLSYLNCGFRWKHFNFHRTRLMNLKTVKSEAFKEALAKTVLQLAEFRMDFTGFYCLLRRILWMKQHTGDKNRPNQVYGTFMDEDLRGMCPRVCSRRASVLDEEVSVPAIDPKTGRPTVLLQSKVVRPEKRTEQCLSSPGLPTVLSGRCHSKRNGKFQNDLTCGPFSSIKMT
ncbi:unnamed protein product [Schistocephalus solidus]|uniref:Mab-21 domain-containing protein n=1 Tax=Schistocephalus solidus TaxID=70667 RepID=A0A183SIP5_SCHSO|nr:unnamed protein product [Schistocephalus solidus]